MATCVEWGLDSRPSEAVKETHGCGSKHNSMQLFGDGNQPSVVYLKGQHGMFTRVGGFRPTAPIFFLIMTIFSELLRVTLGYFPCSGEPSL